MTKKDDKKTTKVKTPRQPSEKPITLSELSADALKRLKLLGITSDDLQ